MPADFPQTWQAAQYAQNGRFVADMAGTILGWLAPHPGEHILDLGCGDGALTERIAATGAHVTGLDSSPSMVAATEARGLQAQQGSGLALSFHASFDAVFSNAALHWMHDQPAVLRGIHAALRPNGRFVAELGGHGNIASIRTALRSTCAPYGIDAEAAGSNVFFTPAGYQALLEAAGFIVDRIELAPRPTPLPTGMRAWLETFRRGLLDRLAPADREMVLQQTVALLEPILCDRAGNWIADYVRLRVHAHI